MSFIKPVSDEPTGETNYLGIDIVCRTLVNYVQSEQIVTPMSIAIHGQWGSGKTNLLKALQKNLDQNKIKVVYFDAWKHESGNPSVALAAKIMKELSGDSQIVKKIIKIAADALIRKTLDMRLDEVVDRLYDGVESSESLSEILEKRINEQIGDNQKLIVLIDDLDRCDIENTLQILAMLKLFLDVKNCICIAAIDFHRVEQAWFSKYGIKETEDSALKEEGRQYLEKIFQVRVPIPHPEDDEKFDYIQSLMKGVSNDYLQLFVKYGPSNPRAIKRSINLISYRKLLGFSEDKEMIAFIWTLLEENLSPEKLIELYEKFESEGGFVPGIESIRESSTKFYDLIDKLNIIRPPSKFTESDSVEDFFMIIANLIKMMESSVGSILRDFSMLYSATKQLQN